MHVNRWVSFALVAFLVYLCMPQPSSGAQGIVRWSKWRPVRAGCPRLCSAAHGVRREGRRCVRCVGRRCRPAAVILCDRQKPAKRTAECYIGGQCRGSGPYTGQWTAWSSREACPRKLRRCRSTRRLMARQCVRSNRSTASFQCPARNGIRGTRYDQCRCRGTTQEQKLKALRDSRHGNWTPWGAWKCTEDCDRPGVLASRHRDCVNYMSGYTCRPDKRGRKSKDKALCREGSQMRCTKTWGSWTGWTACATTCSGGTKKRRRKCEGFGGPCPGEAIDYEPCPVERICPLIDGKWGSWGRWELECSVTCGHGVRQRVRECNQPYPSGGGRQCEGEDRNTQHCHISIICPIHGGWTDWTDWICDRTCNGTLGFRTRVCDNPYPQFGGRFCKGEPKEYTKDCNSQPCPTPKTAIEIPDHILQASGKLLNKTHNAFYKNESEAVEMSCHNRVVTLFKKEFPDSTVRWVKNGKSFKLDPKRMVYKDETIFIKKINFNDTGVYLCQVEYHPKMTKVVDAFTLAVRTLEATTFTQATLTLDLVCHGGPLGIVFPSARQIWMNNGHVFKDYGQVPPQMIGTERLHKITEDMGGLWECKIVDTATNRKWITDAFKAKVAPAPTFWQKVLTPRNTGLAAGFLFCGLAGLLAYCTHMKKKIDKKKKEEFDALLPQLQKGVPDKEKKSKSKSQSKTAVL